jgi:hypothetical protein
VREVTSAGQGAFSSPGSGRALVGDNTESLVTVDHVGSGAIYFVADPAPLTNAGIANADNAALALGLAGPAGRPVSFAEGVHGFGRERGWRAIPHQWKIALLFLAVAALAYVWSRARRFGAPDRRARELPPPRADYVRAMALTLERTHDSARALAPAQSWAREQVGARASLPPDATNDAILKVAHEMDLSDDEARVLVSPVATEADAVALGRSIARINGSPRRNE